jgi:hypothetical protein
MTVDNRRSPRVLLRLGIVIEEPAPACPAHTAVVNRHGALILSPRSYGAEAELRVRHLEWDSPARFRVVWEGGADQGGWHKLGIELLDERPNFWGPDYEREVREG